MSESYLEFISQNTAERADVDYNRHLELMHNSLALDANELDSWVIDQTKTKGWLDVHEMVDNAIDQQLRSLTPSKNDMARIATLLTIRKKYPLSYDPEQ